MAVTTTTTGSIIPDKVGMESSKIFHPAKSNIVCFSYFLEMSKYKAKAKHQIILRNPKLPSLGIGLRAADRHKNMVVCCSIGSGPQIPSNPNPGWLIGILMSIVPFLTGKWGSLLKLKDEAVAVLDKAEAVADIVESVAERVEKVVDDIGNQLPEGKLKDALERFEDFAEDTAEVADKAGAFLDKVEDVVEDIGEKVVESCKTSKSSDEKAEETKEVVAAEEEEAAKAAYGHHA